MWGSTVFVKMGFGLGKVLPKVTTTKTTPLYQLQVINKVDVQKQKSHSQDWFCCTMVLSLF